MTSEPAAPLTFPRWANKALVIATLGIVVGLVYLVALLVYLFAPGTQRQGYQPIQPVPYSHKQHAGLLGMDCRYCHTTVEMAAHAAVPPTQTCMNCHTRILPASELLLPARQSYATGLPVPWVRVHDLPNFVYFNHSAHVDRGVGCVECHDRIDRMDVVRQVAPLTMGWCLDCHRNPEPHLRPLDQVTVMDYVPAQDQATLGTELRERYNLNPPTDCSTCHR
jgi:menaquinone reductase, multiheme cytochrome c subunit